MEIKDQVTNIVTELIKTAKLKKGDLFVVGCSTSEVVGAKIGTDSDPAVAEQIFDGLYPTLKEKGIFLAVQCCEHLNRALVVEKEYIGNGEIVNAVPQKKAGGSLATVAYQKFNCPVLVEEVKADAGIDIGGTLIGMHLKKVAVPVRTAVSKVGKANVICARVRPKFVGGARAVYDETLL